MPRLPRSVFLTAVLAGAVLIATPASAQQTAGLFQPAVNAAGDESTTAFLTAGMVQNQQQAPRRSQGHQGFGFGIKGGFLFNNFQQANQDFKNNTGLAGGIFFGGNRTGVIGVMGEILYAKKGAKSGSVTTDLYYLEIPILARVNIGSSSINGLSFYGLAGPVFDIKLKDKQKNLNIKQNYETFDMGVIAGGGVEFLRLIAEARYNWGLRNIIEGDLANTIKIKNRTFMVLFGFRIN